MWWHHRKYRDELAEAGEQLRDARSQGRSLKEFTDWVHQHLEDNHFAERMLLGPGDPRYRRRAPSPPSKEQFRECPFSYP